MPDSRKPRAPLTFAALLGCLCLLGCEVGPDYHGPSFHLPESWLSAPAQKPNAAADKADAEKATLDRDWWKNFNDPVLERLTAAAAAGNFDLKIATARIAQARAGRTEARAALLPAVNADASVLRQANRLAFPGGGGPFNLAEPFNTYQAGFDASWELDLFGGTRRKTEAAAAKLDEAVDTAADTRIRLMAEVARAYIDVRHAQAQLSVIAETVAADGKTLSLTKDLFKTGATAHVDVTRADAELAGAQAQASSWRNLEAQSEFSLDVLLGAEPGTARNIIEGGKAVSIGGGKAAKAKKAFIPAAGEKPLLAAPAKVIANRPDLRAAERNLAAATAQQGVATAALFPQISLSGFLGLLNVDSGKLLSLRNSLSWSEGASVLQPLFDFGKLHAELRQAKAEKQEALLNYEKAVVSALSDVESALSAYTREEEHRHALQRVVDDDRRAADVALERYKQGTTSFLEVLDAERSLFTARSQAIDSEALASENLVALYKSLGGGWKTGGDAAPKAARPAAKKKTPTP